MKTLKVGIASYEDFKARTMAIARGELKPGANDPKVWFTSIESLAKVLSDRNRELLALIAETKPQSMQELSKASGRARSNLSRTLRTMEKYGLVSFDPGAGRTRVPRVVYTDIVFGMPIQARRSAHQAAHAARTAKRSRRSSHVQGD